MQQWPLCAVADRENIWIARARFEIDGNAIAAGDAGSLSKFRVGNGSHTDEHHVGRCSLATTELHTGYTAIAHIEAGNTRLELKSDALALMKALHERRDRWRSDPCEQARLALDHENVHALEAR